MTQATRASPMLPDPTGMWYDPAQPGWGMSITEQGDTMFVALFVYDANHKPRWYVASNVVMVDTGAPIGFGSHARFSGPLYNTTGATYTNPADTTAPSATPAGTIEIAYLGTPDDKMSVTYTLNGVTVDKTVVPQTWDSSAPMLAGTYSGGINVGDGSSACPVPASLKGITNFTVTAGSTPGQVSINWGTGIDTGCAIGGAYSQQGQLGMFSGPIACGPIPNPVANLGSATITQMKIGPNGFSGVLTYNENPDPNTFCTFVGTIGGVKNAAAAPVAPDFTGLWYDPSQPGWGIQLTTQGNTTFGVLFVYDATHTSEWFASSAVPSGNIPNLGPLFEGPLFRTTGPSYLMPSDTTHLSATTIGDLSIVRNGITAVSLAYNDGATSVTKLIQPQTWSSDMAGLVGTFDGGVFLKGGAQCTLPCPPDGCTPFPPGNQKITISAGATESTVHMAWGTGTANACTMAATYSQVGQSATLTGPLLCTSSGSAPAPIGTLTVSSISIGVAGFTGAASLPTPGCTFEGTIGGVLAQ